MVVNLYSSSPESLRGRGRSKRTAAIQMPMMTTVRWMSVEDPVESEGEKMKATKMSTVEIPARISGACWYESERAKKRGMR